jgi:hypothetical protein
MWRQTNKDSSVINVIVRRVWQICDYYKRVNLFQELNAICSCILTSATALASEPFSGYT